MKVNAKLLRRASKATCLAVSLAVALLLSGAPSEAAFGSLRLSHAADAITELDVKRARRLLEKADPDLPAVAFERARLALYTGDCMGAKAILSSPTFRDSPDGASLGEVARACAGATAGSRIIEDKEKGVWIRLQDAEDAALVPYIVEVADKARRAMARHIGVELPRPLRIDLVRDLFSLSAVTGLPVTAAETTGTVAVARWGRVTMITPRATPLGYPWEDTLAHELAHLALTRATRDKAPLWLQEGLAKRLETQWRAERPFDDRAAHDTRAREALMTGQSVGVDKLGPSIAMLPSPEAASIAFAEVASFVDYWIEKNGEPALRLLFLDMKGLERNSTDAALRSVSGYDLSQWLVQWKHYLVEAEDVSEEPQLEAKAGVPMHRPTPPHNRRREVRLGDLLLDRRHPAAAAKKFERARSGVEASAALRWRSSRARLEAGYPEQARDVLGKLDGLDGPHAGWYALRGRFAHEDGIKEPDPHHLWRLAVSLHPLSEEVACRGYVQRERTHSGDPAQAPQNEMRQELCEAARRMKIR